MTGKRALQHGESPASMGAFNGGTEGVQVEELEVLRFPDRPENTVAA
jgi:hypothetical protein